MENSVLHRKKQLEAEILVAESKLFENIHSLKILDYISPTKDIVPALKNYFLDDPVETIGTLNLLSRNLLSEDNDIRQILKYANLIARGYQMVKESR